MPQSLIDFEWDVDSAGYSLVTGPARAEDDNAIAGPLGIKSFKRARDEEDRGTLRIVRKGGEGVVNRPLDQDSQLYLAFARGVRTPEQALEFVRSHGPLTREGLQQQEYDLPFGDQVDVVLTHAQWMRDFLDPRSVMQRSVRTMLRSQGIPLGVLDVRLALPTRGATPMLRLTPRSLLDALWLQAAHSIMGGVKVRKCDHCGTWFPVGRGTGRRAVARYCCDEHKIAHNSQKRTKGK